MDVEIVKSNGKKYRLSDYGVVQDFVVNSIDRTVTRESVDGRVGSIDYGVSKGDRTIAIPFIFKAEDLHDYAHLRDELYGILDDDEPFYIREMRRKEYLQYEFVDFGYAPRWDNGVDNEYVNGKQYKVRMDGSLSPEQWDDKPNGEITIEFVTSGLPYAESIYTTLELHDSGYAHTAEKYGLVDNIDDEKVQYRFEPEIFREELTKSEWEVGGISSGTGENVISDTLIRTKSYFNTIPGREYVFEELLNSSKISYWWIMEYDNSGNYIGYFATQGNPSTNKGTFTARGHRVRIRPTLRSGQTISVDDVGVNIRPTISGQGLLTSFSVYNAGNVTVEPESMELVIQVSNASTTGTLSLKNITTGEEFRLTKSLSERHISLRGMNILDGTVNAFRDSNRRFISLAPGDNHFEITGATFSEVWFRFKFYYK